MPIVDEAVKRILGMIDIKEELYNCYKYSEQGIVFTNRTEEIIRNMRPHPEVVLGEGEEVLGCYMPMASPGRILIYWQNIGSCFWHTVLQLNRKGYYMDYKDIERIAYLFVLKTYIHEQFHHLCDVSRYLFSSKYDRDVEEALAVAWSYLKLSELRIQWNSKIAMIYTPMYREIVDLIFRYSSPGYREWVSYQTESKFASGIVRYLGPKTSFYLESNGIDVAQIIIGIHKNLGNVLEYLKP